MQRLKKLFNYAVKHPLHSGLIALSLSAAASVPFIPLPQKQTTITGTGETVITSAAPVRENLIDRVRKNARAFPDRDEALLKRLQTECTLVTAETLPFNSESNRTILANAITKAVYKCEIPIAKTKRGEFQPCQGTIFLNTSLFATPNPMKAEEIAMRTEITKIHEGFHALQYTHGSLRFFHTWDLRTRAINTLSYESAAFASTIRVIFESYLAGDDKLYRYITQKLPKSDYDAQNLALFERSFDEYTAKGATKAEALDRASYAVWKNFFVQKNRRDAYNAWAILSYVGYLYGEKGEFHEKIENNNIMDMISKAGYISDNASINRYATAADFENIFGANDDMRQIFDAAEYQRYRKVLGEDDPRTIKRKQDALADQNAYLTLDFKLVLLHYTQAKGDLKLLDVVKGVQAGTFIYESLPNFDPAMKEDNYILTPLNLELYNVDLHEEPPLNKACFVKHAHSANLHTPNARKP
jgi:hypothetical protein